MIISLAYEGWPDGWEDGFMSYACICNGITDKQMDAAAAKARSVEELKEMLNMGDGCGSCLEDLTLGDSIKLVPHYEEEEV